MSHHNEVCHVGCKCRSCRVGVAMRVHGFSMSDAEKFIDGKMKPIDFAHTCIKADGGTAGRKCEACAREARAPQRACNKVTVPLTRLLAMQTEIDTQAKRIKELEEQVDSERAMNAQLTNELDERCTNKRGCKCRPCRVEHAIAP